ncbi:MAG: hypothetical protein HYT87_12705 [Nitrospirae bacterium]|nr:hypothetical protein [Nitrospirota bacterium]
MPRKVHTLVDQPVSILGLDKSDVKPMAIATALGSLITMQLLGVYVAFPIGLLVGIVVGLFRRKARKGKPPGYFAHLKWRWGFPVPGWPNYRRSGWIYGP